MVAQPNPADRGSASGKGRPARKVAAGRNSEAGNVARYRASSEVFSEVRVVPATRSANSLQSSMAAMVYLPSHKPAQRPYGDALWRTGGRNWQLHPHASPGGPRPYSAA